MSKKRKAGQLSAKQLEHYRELLIEKLREIIGDMGAMAESMVEGQTGMAGELARVRAGTDFMVHDMRSMNRNIDDLTASIRRMSGDMAGMDDATARMNQSVFAVNEAMGRMSVDMNRMTRPESLAPMSPFR